MNVYLASRFSKQHVTKTKAIELESLGIHVTSRWLDETAPPDSTLDEHSDGYLQKTAMIDINDIHAADVTVLFTEDPLIGIPRGGRHFESGYAYALQQVFGEGPNGMTLVTCGPKENVFHYLPGVRNFPTWEECKTWLEEENGRRPATSGEPEPAFAEAAC